MTLSCTQCKVLRHVSFPSDQWTVRWTPPGHKMACPLLRDMFNAWSSCMKASLSKVVIRWDLVASDIGHNMLQGSSAVLMKTNLWLLLSTLIAMQSSVLYIILGSLPVCKISTLQAWYLDNGLATRGISRETAGILCIHSRECNE